jgi:hypothetical protein
MKIIIIAAMLLATAPKGCEEDTEEQVVYETPERSEYEAKDYEVRNAIAEWEVFKAGSERNVMAARKRISKATDRLDDTQKHNKLKLRYAIIKSEGLLEQLSEKLLRGERFEEKIKEYKLDGSVIQKMNGFKESYRNKEEKLNEALEKMEKI